MRLKKGDTLPAFRRQIRRKDIERYAEATEDFNPLHTNDDFAMASAFKCIISHGMLVLAYVSEMMAKSFGTEWLTSGGIDARFKHPALVRQIAFSGTCTSILYVKIKETRQYWWVAPK